MPNFLKFTNKQGLIVYGGEASTDYGIVVSEAPAFDKPTRRANIFSVQGRNGSILFQDGSYDDVNRSYKVTLDEDHGDLAEKVNAMTAWLYSMKGYQRLEDSFEPDVFRLAYYNGSGNVSNELMMYGSTDLTFTCRPERFLKVGETVHTLSNGETLYNATRFDAKPLLHIEGSGVVTVTLGGKTITVKGLVDYINIDCDRMDAYRDASENKNSMISGDFPIIVPGTNTLATTGTITKLNITPRFYTI